MPVLPLAKRIAATVAMPLAAILIATAAPAGAAPAGAPVAAAPAATNPFLGTAPYVPLFTQWGNCTIAGQMNQQTGSTLDTNLTNLSNWFRHINNQGTNMTMGTDCLGNGPSTTTWASKLAARGILVSSYRNGSYTSQAAAGSALFNEGPNLEAVAPLAISTFWPGSSTPYGKSTDTSTGGTLAGNLDASSTTVQVTTTPVGAPAGAPATWPFVNSRGTGLAAGAHSSNTHDFVSWLRVDSEIMQIIAPPTVSNGVISVAVRRGIWNTSAASHAAANRVMSPVYIGSSSASGLDASYNGTPARDTTTSPLRYGIKIWTDGGSKWIGDQIGKEFDPTGNHSYQGYTTVWLDVSGCAQYDNADSFGHPVAGWDDPIDTKLGRDSWGAAQQIKYAGIRADMPGLKISANSLGNANDCTNNLLANYVDGGSLENWLKHDSTHALDWPLAMDKNFQIQAGNWPAEYWVRFDEDFKGIPDAYKRFAYGSLLLAKNPSANKFMMGGNFGLNKPDELYFWNWGAPQSSTASIADVAVPGSPLYRRNFVNGSVFVNPSPNPATYNLQGTYLDVVHQTLGNPTPVTSITVPPDDAAFLLFSGPDVQGPSVSTANPSQGEAVPTTPQQTLSGSASDNTGVASVSVTLRNTDTNQYLQTNQTWGATPAQVPTVLSAPRGMVTSWSLPWNPPIVGNYALTVSASDLASNESAPGAAVNFTVFVPDTTNPTAAITSPAQGQALPAGAITVQGTMTDDRGVGGGAVAIQNTATGRWLKADGTYTALQTFIPASLAAPGAMTTGFTYRWATPKPGSYLVVAQATDTSARTATSSQVRFSQDIQGPKVTFTNPTASELFATRSVHVTGTATDNTAVTAVQIAVFDNKANLYWQWNGSWGTAATYHSVTVNSPRTASTTWSTDWTSTLKGYFKITAHAQDTAGNEIGFPPSVFFQITV